MAQFASSDEVFIYWRDQYGLDADGDVNAFALFAYAIVEQDRINWAEHTKEASGAPPSAEATRAWFQDKPPQYFVEKDRLAQSWFLSIARIVLADEIEDERRAAVRETVGTLIVLLLAVTTVDFSVVAWARRVFGFH